MGGHRVAQAVRTEVGGVGDGLQGAMDEAAHHAGVDPGAAVADEDGLAGVAGQLAAPAHPVVESSPGGGAERDGALLAAFAEDADDAASGIQVGQVEAAEFGDPDSAGVEHLKDRQVTAERGPALVRLSLVDECGQSVQRLPDVVDLQGGWQPPVGAR